MSKSGTSSTTGSESPYAKVAAQTNIKTQRKTDAHTEAESKTRITELQTWFAEHVSLFGEAYTLDFDQARAVHDQHHNTLVIARAGSGKTRVIVAKIAYLIAKQGLSPDEIAVFMFNRTAAAEVNQRIAAVEVDGRKLLDGMPSIASTFHKFALDISKASGERLAIISDDEHSQLVNFALQAALKSIRHHASPKEYGELLQLISSFIGRAGQKYPGKLGLKQLQLEIENYINYHQDDSVYRQKILWHRIAFYSYYYYLSGLKLPRIDFNLLMAHAAQILRHLVTSQASYSADATTHGSVAHISGLRYIMIDEYQDFSYLFFDLTCALRELAPSAKLFAVGDDWQAINRFAGSDVDYFINFAKYFPQDQATIPLATNYRSDRQVVEHANRYMLEYYDPQAIPAIAHSRNHGKIQTLRPGKTRFRQDDLLEDGLGDGRFMAAIPDPKAARLLKTVAKIIKHHRRQSIMLLHRHNFTSFNNLSLENFYQATRNHILSEQIMSESEFDTQVRCMTMHKSKGLEADVVILLELDHKTVCSAHPHATIFELFGDTLAAETADQQRLLYVAMTRARHQLYILSDDKHPPI